MKQPVFHGQVRPSLFRGSHGLQTDRCLPETKRGQRAEEWAWNPTAPLMEGSSIHRNWKRAQYAHSQCQPVAPLRPLTSSSGFAGAFGDGACFSTATFSSNASLSLENFFIDLEASTNFGKPCCFSRQKTSGIKKNDMDWKLKKWSFGITLPHTVSFFGLCALTPSVKWAMTRQTSRFSHVYHNVGSSQKWCKKMLLAAMKFHNHRSG